MIKLSKIIDLRTFTQSSIILNQISLLKELAKFMHKQKILKREASSRTIVSPIFNEFRLGAVLSTPSEEIWKIYEAVRRSDDAVCFI